MSAAQLVLAMPSRAAVSNAPQRILLTDPEEQAQAEQRLAIIQMLFDYQRDPDKFGRLHLADGSPVSSFSRMIEYTSETSGVTVRSLYRWIDCYRTGGLAALADKKRSDKNTSRFFSSYPKAAWLVAYLYLDERASVRVAHEAIHRDLELLEIPREDAPSYETVRTWLKQMPASLTVYARNGRKAYRDRMASYLRRGYTDVYANQVAVLDHMIHDVECANDLYDNVEWGAPIRIRLSAMIDYRSRMMLGASWAWEGSSRAIAATMRRAITQYGAPEHIYVDNGKDYKKVARGAMPGYLKESAAAPEGWWRAELEQIEHSGFCSRLGIAVTHCIPHHPQSKHVERFFRTLHERFDKCWPTYTSGNPFTRPDSTSLAMMNHRRLLRSGRVNESSHPLASRFIVACLAWFDEYNATPHTGEGMDGATPREVFEGNLNPNQKPAPEPSTLALLMAEHSVRQVRECAITLNKRRYQPVDRAGWATLHNWNEHEILIAYDPNDWECAAALDLDGCFLAWLQVEDFARFAPGDEKTQEQISESFRIRRGLEKQTRETITTISRVARANGAQSPLEAMANRLKMPANTDGIVTQRKLKQPDAPTAQPTTPAAAARTLLEALKNGNE